MNTNCIRRVSLQMWPTCVKIFHLCSLLFFYFTISPHRYENFKLIHAAKAWRTEIALGHLLVMFGQIVFYYDIAEMWQIQMFQEHLAFALVSCQRPHDSYISARYAQQSIFVVNCLCLYSLNLQTLTFGDIVAVRQYEKA